jgi:hypothetical protein
MDYFDTTINYIFVYFPYFEKMKQTYTICVFECLCVSPPRASVWLNQSL